MVVVRGGALVVVVGAGGLVAVVLGVGRMVVDELVFGELEAVLRTMEADVPIYEPWIRHTEAVEEMLRMGRVAIEHEEIAEEARRQRLEWLRSGRHGASPPSLNVEGTRGLADDYTEVLAKMNADIAARLGAEDNVAMAAEGGR